MADDDRELEVAVNERGRVHMLDRSGSPVTVDEADVQQALDAGFQPESSESVQRRGLEKRYGDAVSTAKATAEGALDAATLGIGTAGLTSLLGDEYAADAAARRDVNPNAYLAGQVVGTVAPALASGGTSAAARGVSAIGAPSRAASALGRVAEGATEAGLRALGYEGRSALARAGASALKTGAGGAVEGAAMGLGNAVSDAALGDTEWTAEHALASMSDGAMFGLAGGAAVGGAGSLLKSAGKAAIEKMAGGETFKDAVQGFAERRAAKSVIGNNQKVYNEITNFGENPERLERLGRKALDNDIPLTDPSKTVRAAGAKAEEAAGVRRAIADEIDAAGVRVDAQKVLGEVQSQIDDLRKVGLGSHDAVAARLETEIAPLKKAVEPRDVPTVSRKPGERPKVEFETQPGRDYTFSDWWRLRQKFDETLNWAKRGGDPATDNLRKLRKTLDSGLDDALARHSDEQAKRMVADGADAAEAQAAGDLATRWKKSGEDYGDFVTLRDAAEEQVIRNEKNRFISPSDYGSGSVLAMIASGSLGALPGIAMGAGMSLGHKFLRERTAGTIAKMADSIARMDVATSRAAKVLAGTAPALRRLPVQAAVRERQSARRKEDFESSLKHVRQFMSDPAYAAAQVEKVIAPFAKEQPEVGQKIAARYSGDMAYLASKAPRSLTSGRSLTPQLAKSSYSKDDTKKFLKIVRALSDPSSVIDDLAEGEIDLDAIDAIKERRPQVWAGIQQKVMTECAAREEELPYKRRVFLSLAFDFQGDDSLDPATLSAIQASTQGTQPEEQAPPPGGGASVDPQAISSSMTLPAQKAMAG